MTARVVVSAHNVAGFPDGGGHFWVYQQYVQGLRRLGADVWWLERFVPTGDAERDRRCIDALVDRLGRFGLRDRVLLHTGDSWLTAARDVADDALAAADLLLNFHYRQAPDMLARFARTALVDIDPGLLQVWIADGKLDVAPHDLYFTTGATVGTPHAVFPDAGLRWLPSQPIVSLGDWPVADDDAGPFTTVSSWWGDEWYAHGADSFENNKRVSFLRFRDIARQSAQELELAINTGPKDQPDIDLMRASGWRVRHALDVAGTPDAYRAYIRSSRGELSCAKPSCARLQNGWISDRTLCYLASGRPAVVEHTGPNPHLDAGAGLLRFSTTDEAVAALDAVAADYDHHRRAARELAETYYDAEKVIRALLERALN